MDKITKTDINNYLKKYKVVQAFKTDNVNNNVILTIELGEKMTKTDNIGLILKELKTINNRLDGIDTRLDSLESDVSSLKKEAKSHGWIIK